MGPEVLWGSWRCSTLTHSTSTQDFQGSRSNTRVWRVGCLTFRGVCAMAGVTRAARWPESTGRPDAYSERVADPAAPRPAPLLLAAILLGIEAVSGLVFGAVALTQIRLSRAIVG